jgi:predicted RNase H-like HicB family nuclease
VPVVKDPTRRFDPKDLKRASEIAKRYSSVLTFDDGSFAMRCIEMPTVVAFGDTPEEAMADYHGCLELALVYKIEEGEEIPLPTNDDQRTQQVNIRLTAMEKLRLEAISKQQGYRSLSDFMRAAAMMRAG